MPPTISVIIPFYNRQHCLLDAVQSVLKQSYPLFELILVDDASTDQSLDLVTAIADPRIRIVRHELNRGAAAARNSGIRSASSPLVAFLDSDDVWMPGKLEIHMDMHIQSGAVASCTSFDMLRENGHRETKHLPENADWKTMFLYGCHVGPGSTMMVERNAFEKIGYLDETLNRLEDWEWLLRLVKEHKFTAFDRALTEVRVSGYPSYEPVKRAALQIVKIQKKYMDAQSWTTLRAAAWVECAYVSYHDGHYPNMIINLVKSFVSSPKAFLHLMRRIMHGRYHAMNIAGK